jgi:hypothetical protein
MIVTALPGNSLQEKTRSPANGKPKKRINGNIGAINTILTPEFQTFVCKMPRK